MLKISNTQIGGWVPTIEGMRNPKNSWSLSDSWFGCKKGDYGHTEQATCGQRCTCDCQFILGPNDQKLMSNLTAGGPVHAKYRRFLMVWVTISAPLYFWKEFKTYRHGKTFVDDEDFYSYDDDHILEDHVEMNSCSTMHKIHSKEFTVDDFSFEHLGGTRQGDDAIKDTIDYLNHFRTMFLETNDKKYWWQMIQLLPSSYNQTRTVVLSYETLGAMYHWRKNHKLDEWQTFCHWVEGLPYSDVIIGAKK